MADIGALVITIGANASELEKAFHNLGGSAKQFQRGMDSISKTMQTAFLAGVTAAVAMTIQAGKTAEETEQLAQKTGIAAVALEGMSVAMMRHGINGQGLATAMKGLSQEMVGVQQGTAASIKLFQEMGLSLSVVERGTGATLKAIADRFKEMPDGALKAKLAVDLFGRSGLDLIPMLNKGAAAFEEAMKKSAEFGLILSETARTELTVFDDAMDDLMGAVKGFGMQVGVAFAPTLTALVTSMTDAVVLAKNIFNGFSDAAATLSIRFAAVVASMQILGQTLFSFQAFSKAAWTEALNHVKAIDAWAAAEIKGVQVAREAEQSLDVLSSAQLTAAQSTQLHAASQQKLGEQIVAATKLQLKQAEEMGKQQERMGANIVSGTQVGLSVDFKEGQRQERLGQQIQDEFAASQQIAQQWVDAYQIEEDASQARFIAEMDALDRNQEAQGRYIVNQAVQAQQVKGFWTTQLNALVASNAFSLAQITTAWSSGIANALVTGGDFVKQAWQSTQIAIIQGGLNLVVQWAAQQAMMATASGAAATVTAAVWEGAALALSGAFATITAGFSTMSSTLVTIVTAVGEFIMGVLTAIGEALGFTGFGAVFAGAILAGVVLIAAALAATGNLGFKEGGIGDFGSGTPAMLHGPEAIIPLNQKGAAFMRDVFGGGGGESITIKVPVNLDGRQVALVQARHTPAAWRRVGAPA